MKRSIFSLILFIPLFVLNVWSAEKSLSFDNAGQTTFQSNHNSDSNVSQTDSSSKEHNFPFACVEEVDEKEEKDSSIDFNFVVNDYFSNSEIVEYLSFPLTTAIQSNQPSRYARFTKLHVLHEVFII